MSTLVQPPTVALTIESLRLNEGRSRQPIQQEQIEMTGLQPVEVSDGGGEVFKLWENDGLLLPRNVAPDFAAKMEGLQARSDDVVIASYPKSGTHWVWEIVTMLKRGSSHLLQDTLMPLDFVPLPMLDALESPRVLSTHLPFSRLPQDLVSQGVKVVWVVRNPWDVAVSYYHFVRKLSVFDYDGDWDGFFDLFVDGNVPYNCWFQHTQDWLKGRETTRNVILVRYEDLKSDFKNEVQRLADFLEVKVNDERLEEIKRETSFENMARHKADLTTHISKDGNSCIFRKGENGDWRNHFTEQQWAELKGAYRVSLSQHQRTLQYKPKHSSWERH